MTAYPQRPTAKLVQMDRGYVVTLISPTDTDGGTKYVYATDATGSVDECEQMKSDIADFFSMYRTGVTVVTR